MTEFPCVAVIFDCDGVLVDSDGSVLSAWRRWADALGFDPDAVTGMVHGRRSADTVAELVAEPQRAAALDLIDRYELEDAASVRAIPGAADLLGTLPPGRWAVVTSGTRALATARLRAAGLPVAGALITADDVTHGKPHPEGYRAAADRLGVEPGDAVVLEDAAAGVAAARAAAIGAVIGVGRRGVDDADAVVPDLTAVGWTGTALKIARVEEKSPADRS